MSDANWIPLFVTADISIEVVNSILKSVAKETFEDGDIVGNRWLLIQHPDQKHFVTPTEFPVSAFQTGFVGASLEQLADYVKSRFGDRREMDGEEEDDMFDFIADDAFAIIDERTARDNSIHFFAEDFVGPVQEAQIRVARGHGAEVDHAWDRFTEDKASNQDVVLLTKDSEVETNLGVDEARTKLLGMVTPEVEDCEMKWAEFRLKSDVALQLLYGIAERGAWTSLVDRDGDFDEDGVMIV